MAEEAQAPDERFAATARSKNPVTRAIGPGTTATSQTLYERIGGEPVLDQIVTDVYNWMKADKDIGKPFSRFRIERLKDRTVDYLRGEWGGPTPYQGSDLWISHSHLAVKNQWYDIMMKFWVKAIRKARLGKQEEKEIIASIEKMRGPIVDRDLKLKNMYLKYSEKLATASGGDGWGVSGAEAEREKRGREAAAAEQLQRQKEQQVLEEQRRTAAALEAAKKEALALEQAEANEQPKEAKKPKAKSGGKAKAKNQGGGDEFSSGSTKDTSSANGSDAQVAKPGAAKVASLIDPAFTFAPGEDAPPGPVPSSAPSGAELIYRLCVPCPGHAPVAVA